MIQITDQIRIRKLDRYNLAVEVLVNTTNTKTEEQKFKWKLYGYYGNLYKALKGSINAALDYDILCGEGRVKDIDVLLKTVNTIEKIYNNLNKTPPLTTQL